MDSRLSKVFSTRIVDLATGGEVEQTIIPKIMEESFTRTTKDAPPYRRGGFTISIILDGKGD